MNTGKTSIYFVQAASGEIKIGLSNDVAARIVDLQRGSAATLTLLASVSGTHRTERQIHESFHHLRTHGEWFRSDPTLLEFINKIKANPAPQIVPRKSGPKRCLGCRSLMADGVKGCRLWHEMLPDKFRTYEPLCVKCYDAHMAVVHGAK